jgi:hypothetical protein
MQGLQQNGWKVAAISPSRESQHREALEALGVATHSCDPNRSAEADAVLASLSPSLAIFDRFVMEEQFGWRARAHWPGALHLVDTQDLHSVRRARERLAKSRQGPPDWQALEAPTIAALGEDLLRELAALYRADGALVVSSWERDVLAEKLGFPAGRLLWQPLEGHRAAEVPPFASRSGFACLGNFRHPPNRDAIDWLLAELWPELRAALPSVELHLYGAYPPAEISRHKGANGIFSHGPVEDHRAALARHRALLAPLRFGAGIKGKVLEAWGTGTPVLGSPLTFEGMGSIGASFRDHASFVQEAVSLHEQEAPWLAQQKQGFAALELHFKPTALRARFNDFVRSGLSQLNEIRSNNLTGAMLRHHGANSSKYFSRWIEAKNQKPG